MERELPELFKRIKQPKLVMMFIDACFSGRAGGRTFEGARLKRARAETRESRESGLISLKNLDLGEGRLMISACGDDQVAREEGALGHGIFTHYLLRGPRSTRDLTIIGVLSLYDELARAVQMHTSGLQVPVINGRAAAAQLPFL